MKAGFFVSLLVIAAQVGNGHGVSDSDTPCCVTCSTPGQEKYYSIDHIFNQCGECCFEPSKFWEYKIFEPGLTKANASHPCSDHGYGNYTETVTHGAGNIHMTLDMYKAVKTISNETNTPCCEACPTLGHRKYYSIDRSANTCGESCLEPTKFQEYKKLEPGLTYSDGTSSHPCSDHGFAKYTETLTESAGEIKMTRDMYTLAGQKHSSGSASFIK
ncbi:hypothetical protein CYMTET_34473 [Cymbomonas tetramitiformis]|uniref:Uncharacterized protein n=1 Tax=Cymbomonas tetramitiformis TaxID=36881 RepID=A0AAE0FAU6_9CHLO|nr:hypothetical protein CYMTET_34473 [Cymbomonas tetramitiformis]|eukprot:gene27740-34250_t